MSGKLYYNNQVMGYDGKCIMLPALIIEFNISFSANFIYFHGASLAFQE
jgi:hypothetical protein